MIEDDEQNSDRSETFYVGSKAPVIRCGPRLVARREKSLVKCQRVQADHPLPVRGKS